MLKRKPRVQPFIQAGERLIRADAVTRVDLDRLDELVVTLHFDGCSAVAEGVYALEALMLLKPSALEGRRLRWARRAWLVHNLVGHPLMQLLALAKLHRAALYVHDATVPRPLGPRSATDAK